MLDGIVYATNPTDLLLLPMKKLIAALAASALLMSAASAQTVPAPQIAARSWLLLDATSGQIIASQDPDARIEPASLTKVMTAYVVFEALRDKKITLDQMVNVSVRAWKVDGSSSKMFIDRPPRSRSRTCCTA